MTTQVERQNEISLDGVKYRIDGPVQSVLASVYDLGLSVLSAIVRLASLGFSASTTALGASFVVKIVANQRMIIHAMSSFSSTNPLKPSPQVRTTSYWLKMLRINTSTVTAKMVKVKPLWDGAIRVFPRGAVSLIATVLSIKMAIPKGGNTPRPQPAGSSLIDFGPESFRLWPSQSIRSPEKRVSVTPQSVIMPRAISLPLCRLRTIRNLASVYLHVSYYSIVAG